jgi:5,10-methylenetetrahydrofolate reductase
MQLKNKLDTGEFTVLAEMEPPKGVDVSMMETHAMRAKGRVDAFVVPDMNDAVLRMSALGGAVVLHGKGMETVMQVTCRDRNRLALQADLLAAHACGITSIIIARGEEPAYGDHHEAQGVYDLEPLELLDAVQKLQQGKDMAGIDLAGFPRFLVGSTVNPGAKNDALSRELDEMKRKREAGVQFFVTPPLFDIAFIDPFLKRADRQKATLIPTVLVLKSVGMARYIDRHQAHIHIPDAMVNRIQGATDKPRECIQIAAEIVSKLRDEGFGGVLLSTIGWEDRISEILEMADFSSDPG